VIFLAFRYLLARRRQTILTLLGIFLGTAAYVAISGFMLGFQDYFIEQMINNSPHIYIRAREDFLTPHSLDHSFYNSQYQYVFWDPPPSGRKDNAIIESPQSWYERLSQDPRVQAYSPQLTTSVIFNNGKATATSNLIGCNPDQQIRITTIGKYITEGRFTDLNVGGNRVVIGEELQKKLGVRVQQNVLISLANNSPKPFKVVGIFKTGTKNADGLAYAALTDVQSINQTPNQVNEIAVRLYDHTQASNLALTWSQLSPEKIESWDQINSNMFGVFRMQDMVRYLMISSILVVASFGIYNILNMAVVQKRKDIAILRSIGYGPTDIILLFFSQGLILGVVGTGLGLFFGYFFSLYLETIPFAGGPMGSGTGHLMVSLKPSIYEQATLMGLASATIASILPAYSAGALTPIEIIRAGTE